MFYKADYKIIHYFEIIKKNSHKNYGINICLHLIVIKMQKSCLNVTALRFV